MLLNKIFWHLWRKKNNLIQFLSYNLMLNSEEKNSRFARQRKINILTPVLSEKKFMNEKKTYPPSHFAS